MTDLPVCLAPSGVKNCLTETSCHLPTIGDCAVHKVKLDKAKVIQVISEAFIVEEIKTDLMSIFFILMSEV